MKFLYYYPNLLGHTDNYIKANPMVTPTHIVPEWYFLPFYAILRSVPDKLGGVVLLLASILVLLALPFYANSKVRSSAFRSLNKIFFWFFFSTCLLLGWIGGKNIENIWTKHGKNIAEMTFSTLFPCIFHLCTNPIFQKWKWESLLLGIAFLWC